MYDPHNLQTKKTHNQQTEGEYRLIADDNIKKLLLEQKIKII